MGTYKVAGNVPILETQCYTYTFICIKPLSCSYDLYRILNVFKLLLK